MNYINVMNYDAEVRYGLNAERASEIVGTPSRHPPRVLKTLLIEARILYRHKDDSRMKRTDLKPKYSRPIRFASGEPELDDPTAFNQEYAKPCDISIGKGKVKRWRLPWKQF